MVAEVVPLKQGLKHAIRDCKKAMNNCCRGSSIKTRIETTCIQYCNSLIMGCRGSSIKTRIETILNCFSRCISIWVAEVVPLKQGLKHDLSTDSMSDKKLLVAEVVPLKQGLKLIPDRVIIV